MQKQHNKIDIHIERPTPDNPWWTASYMLKGYLTTDRYDSKPTKAWIKRSMERRLKELEKEGL